METLRARSHKNGIIFFSNKFPELCFEITVDNCGKINRRIICEEYINENCTHSIVFKTLYLVFDVLLIISSFIVSILSGKHGFLVAAIFFAIFVSKDLFDLLSRSYGINSKEHSTAKLHAAIHMVLNAYETLQRIPKLEEVKRFSRLSKTCECNITFYSIFSHTLMSLVPIFFWENTLLLIGCNFLIFLLVQAIISVNLLIFLQFFITATPTNKELILALEGLKSFIYIEEKLLNDEQYLFLAKAPDGTVFKPPFPHLQVLKLY